MEKSATLNIRVNPDVKRTAETVLSQLGIPMATAIDVFLKQVALTGGIPFQITLPKTPATLNTDLMNVSEIRAKLQEGLVDIENGNTYRAIDAFANFREKHSNENV